MDFSFTPREEGFRQEIRHFAEQELPPGWLGMTDEEYAPEVWPITRQVAGKLGKRGWLALGWPQEYGGGDAPITYQLIFQEEAIYWGIPGTGMGIGGTAWVGHSLLLFGTEAQKREHIPPIATGERFWCTGYSEPEAGSDLASLQCRARRAGDGFIIDGQKVWTSAAHIADWCWLAARTNPDVPQHKGISLFLVDMKSPGITVRPILNIAGVHSFNEVYFDGVRLPWEHLVGEVDRGWYYVMTALDFERAWPGIRYASVARRILDELVKYAQEHGAAAEDRHRLAELGVETAVGRLLAYRVVDVIAHGRVPNYEASQVKVFCTELVTRAAQVGMELLGLWGQLEPGSPGARLQGWIERLYLLSVGHKIAGGTSEVQRNIIALRGLGLPR